MSEQTGQTSYLNYLPPVLWAGEFPLLGEMLRVFEKILTGIDDGLVIQHGDHEHEAIEVVIANIYQLFDPWHTPPPFLDWLASLVGLEFPVIWDPQQQTYVPFWDEYQRRKAISQIVQIYQKRGLKEGLNSYLDLYTIADKRPRIAVDDGSRVLFIKPQTGYFAQVSTLVGQGPYTHDGIVSVDGLIAPRSIALAPDGSLLLCDNGTPTGWNPVVGKGVWRVFPTGQYALSGTTGTPQRVGPPFGPQTWNLSLPVAVAVDNASPWNVYVLDNVLQTGATALYQLPSPNFAVVNALATKATLGTVWPIAMTFDLNGHLLILDRGTSAPSGAAAAPKIIDVQINPLVVTAHPLDATRVIEPLSLTVLPNRNLLIGDGRQQNAVVSADIVLVDRSNSASWVQTPLLVAVPSGQNPLVAPVGVLRKDDTHLYVLDLGLKPYLPQLDPNLASEPFRRNIAEAAVLYSVDLGPSPPVVTRASEIGQLVYPTGIVQDQAGMLYISDRGEYSDPQLSGEILRVWRAAPYQFGIAVHFSEQRPTTTQDRRQIFQNISEIITQEKPAHTDWAMVYAV